jgi:competence protein ComFA
MRAFVYVADVGGGWRARMSICPEVDRYFWTNNPIAGEGLTSHSFRLGWCWKQELPLGDACRAVELWEEQSDEQTGRSKWSDEEALLRLQACVEQALREGGDHEAAVAGKGRVGQEVIKWLARKLQGGQAGVRKQSVWLQRGQAGAEKQSGWLQKREAGVEKQSGWFQKWQAGAAKQSVWLQKVQAGAGKQSMWPRSWGLQGAESQEPTRLRLQAAADIAERWEPDGERGMPSELEGLAEAAERAADALQGRALLRSEAHDLLLGAGVPEPGASWSGVLQLAALLGRVRLSGSVAAAASGGRADARGRRRRERSCLRCGSGEALLSRSACAACGRICAYCTACIGMGRSRECELLVTAPLVGAGRREKLAPISKRLAEWGLSPAQTAAARAALHYVEKEGTGGGSDKANMSLRETGGTGKGNMPHKMADGIGKGGLSLKVDEEMGKGDLSSKETGEMSKGSMSYKMAAEMSKGNKPFKVADRATLPTRSFLLWAVTGAGKTEMVFPLVESALLRGGRALIATPRRDVVIELDPRIRKAFPNASVVTLYGGSEQRWERGDITLATTHQLIRFYQGFELVIIDELDAFPFHNDKMLHYAADKSCAPGAARILLSATPPAELQRAVRRGHLPHARVPVRYHRHPLPVPVLLRTPTVQQMLEQRKLPRSLHSALQRSLERGAQLFVFVQRIAQTEPMAELLRAALQRLEPRAAKQRSQKARMAERVAAPVAVNPFDQSTPFQETQIVEVAATSSQDEERAVKVQRFRSREIRVLVTTTILERGVTIPQSDVYILDADGKLLDEASLVQMAGRAGRSADDPFGRVYFCSRERNRAQTDAVRHIRTMNKMALKQGFLLPQGTAANRESKE